MKHFRILAATAILVFFPGAQAQSPVKSVDEKGRVTYSNRPAKDAVSATEVPIQPGPDEERVKEARERARQIREQADKAAAERRALEEQRAREREAAREKRSMAPEVIVIEKESAYPAYNHNPPPVTPNQPGTAPGRPDHPAFRPRPPVTTPVIRPLPKAR